MERILIELSRECEITARMYAQGYEKKEIADMKCRAVSTINNQLQKAFEALKVRNGRELSTIIHERLSGIKLTMDFAPIIRSALAVCFIGVFSITFCPDFKADMRVRRICVRQVRRNSENHNPLIFM